MTVEIATYWVRHSGRFSDVAQGDFRASIDMQSLAGMPHLYALGPVEGQTGEITVFDSRPDIATVEHGQARVHPAWPKACFLVYASVSRWAQAPLPSDVKTLAQLEDYLGRAAANRQLASPFPFVIQGTPASLSYHIANMMPGETLPPGQARRQAKFVLADQPVEMLGFYSDRHHGIFTHPGKNLHVHFTASNGQTSGHVDDLLLQGGVLSLPGV